MALAEYLAQIEQVRKFGEEHPEASHVVELVHSLAAELAAAEDFIDSTDTGASLGAPASAVPNISVPS